MKPIQSYISWMFIFFVTGSMLTHVSYANQKVILYSLENQFREPEFAKEILPNDFSSLVFLIECGKNTNYPIGYTNALFKAFTTLIKGSEYVNPYAFIEFITQAPSLLQNYFIPYKISRFLKDDKNINAPSLDRLQEGFSVMLYDTFITHYGSFKQDPDTFLHELAMHAFFLAEEQITIQALRNSVLKFIDLAIGKLVWSSRDPISSWQTTKDIAEKLITLVTHNIIVDVTEINDLCWSLVYRFCFFIDIQNDKLPLSFYESIQKEIQQNNFLFLDLPEDTTFLETKHSRIMRALMTAQAKIRLHSKVQI